MDKQFKASDKKRKKARKEGNFAKSSEMLPLVSSGIFVGLLYFGYRFSSVLVSQFRLMLAMSLSGSVTTGHLIQQ